MINKLICLNITGVVTTLNNADTLGLCLTSLRAVCSELVVLDSGSTDRTREIAESFGARFHLQSFAGYSAQKAAAITLATADWIVLLDSDESLDSTAQAAICAALAKQPTTICGFRLKRRELIFWRYQHTLSKHNRFLRVFDRRKAQMSAHAVHESVLVSGETIDLEGCLVHAGDRSIEQKLTKLNQYSSLAAHEKRPLSALSSALRITLYPVWYFFRAYIVRRQFLNGWAGYINSIELAHYAFLKYAKMLEKVKRARAEKDDSI